MNWYGQPRKLPPNNIKYLTLITALKYLFSPSKYIQYYETKTLQEALDSLIGAGAPQKEKIWKFEFPMSKHVNKVLIIVFESLIGH